jgi:uncharacterized membrane protein YfcA
VPELGLLLAAGSGSLVGFTLALVGGGGSILAVPLLVYVVGISNPHIAIGTSAVGVAVNAGISLIGRARAGTVKWRCVTVFTALGMTGALLGAWLGKQIDGQALLALFALLMIAVGFAMLRGGEREGEPGVRLSRDNFPKLAGAGLGTGLVSGFFGIGGGFLIVPGLIAATAMPIANAIASSLVAITAFGATTAASYAFARLVDWVIAGTFIAGGIVGGLAGAGLARRLSARRGILTRIFALLIFAVAGVMLGRALGA